MKKFILQLAAFAFGICFSSGILFAADQPKVVATHSVLAALAREVMPDADIHTIAAPGRDIHFYNPTPKDVIKVKKANVFVHGGLDLESWRDPLLEAAANKKFLGAAGNSIDTSKGVQLLEIPESLSRINGDIHMHGNPHFWTDPKNAQTIVDTIAEGLAAIYPDRAAEFQSNAQAFRQKLDQKLGEWENRISRYQGKSIVTYHKSWPYFAQRFGLRVVAHLEPLPGIPPTGKHLMELTEVMKKENTKIIVREIFQDEKACKKIANQVGAQIAILSQFVGGADKQKDYLGLMEYNVTMIEEAFKKAGE